MGVPLASSTTTRPLPTTTDSSHQQISNARRSDPMIVVGVIVYLALFLDNALLTVVVPIVPDYLMHIESFAAENTPVSALSNESLTVYEKEVNRENSRVGMLLSSKAFVQLFVNPIVGSLARTYGYHLPLFCGCVNLLASTLLFGFGESYLALFTARSLQGIASSCIGVCSMCLVAKACSTEDSRSKKMGIILGSVALGVLLGYPFGALLYEFMGKAAPFIGIAVLITLTIGLQLIFFDFKFHRSVNQTQWEWRTFLRDRSIMLTAGAVCVSTTAMAVLEPCLPLWLMSTIKPEDEVRILNFLPCQLLGPYEERGPAVEKAQGAKLPTL